jgi:hypothetical protein
MEKLQPPSRREKKNGKTSATVAEREKKMEKLQPSPPREEKSYKNLAAAADQIIGLQLYLEAQFQKYSKQFLRDRNLN